MTLLLMILLMSCKQAYDHQTGYEMPFFRPSMDESMRGQGVPSPGEVSKYCAPSIHMWQTAYLHPQLQCFNSNQFLDCIHKFMSLISQISCRARRFLSPVYVPSMGVPGYSNNPAYPHPSNGNGYLLMPGGSSHLAPGGLKYGASQYKPIPTGTPTRFGSYSNPAGYTLNA
ncbi:hypothetical protein IFM89_002051 [Coptis chinensis]|uniref:Uncharacterized protein n=1 Tax=Coptis chinensis TaxID=261450 RepID=A0A835HBZ6_9MAGN|nr:hypothetical protein IFM89_002051 [Coptis chinensis]